MSQPSVIDAAVACVSIALLSFGAGYYAAGDGPVVVYRDAPTTERAMNLQSKVISEQESVIKLGNEALSLCSDNYNTLKEAVFGETE